MTLEQLQDKAETEAGFIANFKIVFALTVQKAEPLDAFRKSLVKYQGGMCEKQHATT